MPLAPKPSAVRNPSSTGSYGMIGGKSAGQTLKELRASLAAKGLPTFSAGRAEREYDEMLKADAESAAARTAGLSAAPKLTADPTLTTARTTPTTTTPVVTKPVKMPGSGTQPVASPTPDEPITRGPSYALGGATKAALVRQSAKNLGAAREGAQTAKRLQAARDIVGRNLNRQTLDKIDVQRIKDAPDVAAQRKAVSERLARRATDAADAAKDAKTLKNLVAKDDKALANKAAKAAEAAAKAAEAAEKTGRLAKVAQGTAKIAGTAGKMLSKVAVPLEVGMMALEGGRLAFDEDFRDQRYKDFERTAGKGGLKESLSSSLDSALNPVAGFYATGRALSELGESARGAEQSARDLQDAQDRQRAQRTAMLLARVDRTTPEMAKAIRALPPEERKRALRARAEQFRKFRS